VRRAWNAQPVPNDIHLLRTTLKDLGEAGFTAAVFGGWAEELIGLSRPRQHHDIDLLVIDADIERLDTFVQNCGEVVAKHHPHKRGFITQGVLVELFIVRTVDGQLFTNFWNSLHYQWPDIGPVDVDGLPVASAGALRAYRADHARISETRL
jgi:hypothetical protein